MRLLLIVPRYNNTNKIDYNYTFPLGLGYISAVLKKEGHNPDILNLNHHDGTIKNIIKNFLDKKRYDFILTGHSGIGYNVVKEIIDSVRSHVSKPKIILGGAIITSEPTLMFNSLKPDFGIIGEGEVTIIELLKCLEKKGNLEKVDGIIFFEENKVCSTNKRTLITNLDSIPFPNFENFGIKEQINNMHTNEHFVNNLLDNPKSYSILGSRGCPFNCTFCYHVLGDKHRIRSIKNIIEEIKMAIKNYKINCLLLYDDLFSINKKRLYEFCREIKKLQRETKQKLKWSCQLSVINADREMFKTIKEAGCEIVSWGFESMSSTILKSMKKPITPQQIDKVINLSFEFKMGIQANFIFGDIAETRETAYETLDYWKKKCKGQVSLYFIQPYPKSSIYEHCIEKRIIKNKLDFIANKMYSGIWENMTNSMTDKEFEIVKHEIFKAQRKYRKYIIPLSVKKIKENNYEVKIKCPYCKKEILYKNFCIKNRLLYSYFIMCRECKMRYRMVSFLKKVENNYYPILSIFKKYYSKIRHNF
ncbi:radical SAM protein [Candidatus Pacearchaeota archaeon]|nr:radical SAM protein [Candidatus Pacearchaeota archaeon]